VGAWVDVATGWSTPLAPRPEVVQDFSRQQVEFISHPAQYLACIGAVREPRQEYPGRTVELY
jgi:hypothetical protein